MAADLTLDLDLAAITDESRKLAASIKPGSDPPSRSGVRYAVAEMVGSTGVRVVAATRRSAGVLPETGSTLPGRIRNSA